MRLIGHSCEHQTSEPARLTDKGVNVFADYRLDLCAGPPWLMGHGRYQHTDQVFEAARNLELRGSCSVSSTRIPAA